MTKKDRDLLERFALDHKLVFEEKGEIGFGRPCVGFTKGTSYVYYNPMDSTTFKVIQGFEDERIRENTPENAYHKSDCLAVLVHNNDYETAIQELVQWVKSLNELGVEIVEYETGATGIQAMFSGFTGYAMRPKA